ncbi:C-C motif chemokine 24-like [Pangasianodon hypophthalmus]|uniref:C-C motif chemokine 24-like n=1 Tax=Pangasianodon hypophthalmus TaxID=310915 RepID=UPI000EFF4E36|nr:C-C motif chemokine 24-like [Pangasianodon hypophthalmus]
MRNPAAIVAIAFTIWIATDAEKVSPCCVAVSRYMEDVTITGYRLQEKNLPCIKAVVFQTERGQFCIDPYQPWVKKKIIEFRRSQKNKMSPTSASLHLTSAPRDSTASTQRVKQQTTAHFSE